MDPGPDKWKFYLFAKFSNSEILEKNKGILLTEKFDFLKFAFT